MTDANETSYDGRSHRQTIRMALMIGAFFLFAIVVFAMMFGAGHFLEGS